MALLFMDGLDYYNTSALVGLGGAGWDNVVGTPSFGLGVYGYGGQITTSNFGMSRTLSGNVSTFIYGAHYTPDGLSSGTTPIISLFDAATVQASLRVTSSGAFELWRGTTTALLGTSTVCLKVGVPVWVSFKIVFSATVGTFTMKVNGATVLTLTGLNNIVSANAYMNIFRLNQGAAILGKHDNVFMCDDSGSAPYNDILDERRIYFLLPTGAGTASQFTANGSATFWQCTDENPSNGDTDYGSSTTPTNRSDTTRAALTGPTVIDAVKYNLTMRKDDAGVRTLSPTVRQGGVYYDATAISLTTVYQLYPTYYLTQPDGSGVWTLTALNAAEFGVLDAA